MARDESPKALTDEIQKKGSLTYDLHLFSANQKNFHKVLTDSPFSLTDVCRRKGYFIGEHDVEDSFFSRFGLNGLVI